MRASVAIFRTSGVCGSPMCCEGGGGKMSVDQGRERAAHEVGGFKEGNREVFVTRRMPVSS